MVLRYVLNDLLVAIIQRCSITSAKAIHRHQRSGLCCPTPENVVYLRPFHVEKVLLGSNNIGHLRPHPMEGPLMASHLTKAFGLESGLSPWSLIQRSAN